VRPGASGSDAAKEQASGTLPGSVIAAGACPLAQAGLDKAFGLAVDAWCVGLGSEMTERDHRSKKIASYFWGNGSSATKR